MSADYTHTYTTDDGVKPLSKLIRAKQVLRHVLISSVNNVTIVHHNPVI